MMIVMMMIMNHLWSWSRVTRLMTRSQQGWSRSRLLSLVVVIRRMLVMVIILIVIIVVVIIVIIIIIIVVLSSLS